ncbi:uncharacterized protein LOC141789270 [Halichoeres trimaculatus]|uniref:uncharacterized protein LOC141789270 n=1 Tax=Halichoeres trimaculatus TaxID=147232 RepID=UPI003D9E6307
MAMPNFSRYDHISKKLIHPGSPALYQLNLTKDTTGGVTKMTLGQKDPIRTNRTILLVGETGTGKSTLINALTNYAMGVKWEDDVWFKIVEEEKRAQSESQTSDVIMYKIFGFEGETLPFSLTIIDTPGYGDTRGTEQDDIVSKRLYDLFRSENGVYEINVVGLVLKASENRLSDRSRYIFDSVVSLFGNDMEKNIVCLFTHSDGFKPEDALGAIKAANVKCAMNEIDEEPVHFLFSNRQKDDRRKNAARLKQEEQRTTETLKEFSEFLERAAPQNLMKTVRVLNSRMKLTACLKNLQEQVQEIELKQREVQQTQDALRRHEAAMKSNEEEMKSKEGTLKENQEETQQTKDTLKKHEAEKEKNKNFIVEVDESSKVKQPIDGGMCGFLWLDYMGAVCCTVCEANCHYPGCTAAWYPSECKVMEEGHCTVCSGKCPVSKHVKEKWIYVTQTRKVQKTLEDVKKKYEESIKNIAEKKAKLEFLEKTKINQGDIEDVKEKYEKSKTDCEDVSDLLEALEMEMKKLQEDKDQCLEEAFQHVVKLEQIALNADSLSTHVHVDFLIERMKERGDTEKARKLEEIKNRLGEGAKMGLGYTPTAAGKRLKTH